MGEIILRMSRFLLSSFMWIWGWVLHPDSSGAASCSAGTCTGSPGETCSTGCVKVPEFNEKKKNKIGRDSLHSLSVLTSAFQLRWSHSHCICHFSCTLFLSSPQICSCNTFSWSAPSLLCWPSCSYTMMTMNICHSLVPTWSYQLKSLLLKANLSPWDGRLLLLSPQSSKLPS